MAEPKRETLSTADAPRLRRVRDILGLSQREFAKMLGVANGAIAQWEAGRRRMPKPVGMLLRLYEERIGVGTASSSEPPVGWLSRNAANAEAAALWALFHGPVSLDDAPFLGDVRAAAIRRAISTLANLKGLSMKFAQMATYMDLALPEAEQARLTEIQQSANPMPAKSVRHVIERDFDQLPNELFAEWSSEPMAVASIGQVHQARLPSGERVAVKVQYPRIVEMLRADLANVQILDKLLSIVTPGQESGVFYNELRTRVLEECDYELEAKRQERFRTIFAGRAHMSIPDVHPAFSSPHVLTSTLVDGTSLGEFAATATRAQRNRAGMTIWTFYYEAVLAHRVFNTDPHPGNFVFEGDTVHFIDFGRVKEFSPSFLENWRRMIKAMLERDLVAYRREIVAMGCAPNPSNFDYHYSYRALLCFYLPYLSDEPFHVTPRYVAKMWSLYARENVNRDRTNYPSDLVFLNQLYFGVFAILARLDATIDCRKRFLELTYGSDAATWPLPYTPEEIRTLDIA